MTTFLLILSLLQAAPPRETPPEIAVSASATPTRDGFRVAVKAATNYPEGTLLDIALARRAPLQIDERYYKPLEIIQTARTGGDGACSLTIDAPESFVLPGRYDITVSCAPGKQPLNVGKVMAERRIPLKEFSAAATVTLSDPDRFKSILIDDLDDFVKIASTLRQVNELMAAFNPEKSVDPKERAKVLQTMDTLSGLMLHRDNRTYFPQVRAEVAVFISYIPKLKFTATQKPDYVKEEEEAIEKHNQKMREEGKEEAVIKLPNEREILQSTSKKINLFFLCACSAEIMDAVARAAEDLRETPLAGTSAREIAAIGKIVGEFDRSAYGEAAKSLFRDDDGPLIERSLDEAKALQKALEDSSKGTVPPPDDKTIRGRFESIASCRAKFDKIVMEHLSQYRTPDDAEKTPPPEDEEGKKAGPPK